MLQYIGYERVKHSRHIVPKARGITFLTDLLIYWFHSGGANEIDYENNYIVPQTMAIGSKKHKN